METVPPETWGDLNTRIKTALASTSSARPFLSQREKRTIQFDPLPHFIDEEEWSFLVKGIRQRTKLLNLVLKDLYGEQKCLLEGWIDIPELYSLKNYVLASHGSIGLAQPQLHLHHIQVTKQGDRFVVLKDITSTPRQLGHVLEHRLVQNRYLHQAQMKLKLRRLAPWFSNFRNELYKNSPISTESVFGVVLAQGVDHEYHDEQAYLAHYLGLPVVEAQDLVVRDKMLYLKNLHQLQRIHFVLRRVPEKGLDPLEMEDHSLQNIPGMMDVLRQQNVFMDSVPGVGILEKNVLFNTVPKLCQYFLGEDLLLNQAKPELSSFDTEALSPCFSMEGSRSVSFKCQLYVSTFHDDIQVMPGGLAISNDPNLPIVKDIWICGGSQQHYRTLLDYQTDFNSPLSNLSVPSRVADATLWFGRYVERSDTLSRVLREVLVEPLREETIVDHSLFHLDLIQKALEIQPSEDEPSWQESWMRLTGDVQAVGSLHFNLSAVQRNAMMLQDRISVDMLNISQTLTQPFEKGFDIWDGEPALSSTIQRLAAITGLSHDSMTHSDEWNFLIIGRRLERATTTISLLKVLIDVSDQDISFGDNTWELLLRTFDSIMTYRRRYHIGLMPSAIFFMMVQDTTNPRSVAYQVEDMSKICQGMSQQGALWAVEHYQNLQMIMNSLKQLPPLDDLSASELGAVGTQTQGESDKTSLNSSHQGQQQGVIAPEGSHSILISKLDLLQTSLVDFHQELIRTLLHL